FLGGALLAGGALTSTLVLPEALAEEAILAPVTDPGAAIADDPAAAAAIDFRYSPAFRQTAYCFPDDPYKSVMNEKGTLLYGYDRDKQIDYFPLIINFALGGMKPASFVEQTLESPAVPIVRTTLQRADATMLLTTFATRNPGEGRVDNVLIEIFPTGSASVHVSPVVEIHSEDDFTAAMMDQMVVVANPKTKGVLLVAKVLDNPPEAEFTGQFFDPAANIMKPLTFHAGVASTARPYRVLVRFPQAGQTAAQLQGGLENPDAQMASAREFWSAWSPFQTPVSWQVSGRRGEFVTACARNILQARELKDGKLTFQVGPTCYRGLWVVDGNFILEAARYLGYDKEAAEGLRTTWSMQQKTGQVVAGGGSEHYKDTAIAMFTLVRQCELSQDWSALREFQPNVVAALAYIDSLRARARSEGGIMGHYGLLPKGFADGGLGGSRDEFTNTLWTLAGLKAIGAAGEQQQIPQIARASGMYRELLAAFNQAASQQMRSDDGQFQYLPMLMKEDPDWQLPDPWDRPRPQTAQWALSHTIFPGIVFDPSDPVVRGHVRLMQAVRQESVPAETGWSQHEAVWNYNAAFVAEVYLWLGMKQAANDTFVGFLNHASPQYCWREEQPLQHALLGSYVGDMPHNWASAECIRYMRHVLALEDGPDLRLLAGITEDQLVPGQPFRLTGTPTRFGRLNIDLEPLDRKQGWRLNFRRAEGPVPARVSVPLTLGDRFHLAASKTVQWKRDRDFASVDPAAREWSLTWTA
ncbi:MAG TPA: hypothetical protein VMV98_06500, partial [Acidobacteriaceae bacterium]|nr:hypothetical protein [Acidobacteriaceae bacterium]